MGSSGADHEVVVIGAGFSGLGAGIKLKAAGIDDFVILERATDVGGTWRDNSYPGLAVDVTSLTYSFSFAPNPDWSRLYAPGAELKAYADHCVERYGLGPHLRLGTTVTRMVFDATEHLWRVCVEDGPVVSARFVITATGGLIQPKRPDIAGIDDFAGTTMHTARWDHDHELQGQRVGVVGTGATAVQLVPEIASRAERLHVFQRTPIWVFPKFDHVFSARAKWLFRRFPPAQRALRLVAAVLTELAMVLGVVHNRQFPVVRTRAERVCRAHLRRQVSHPELRDRLLPGYPLGCKRPTFSNEYLASFMRDDVELVTEAIERVTAAGIRTEDGREIELDTLVLATGYKVFEPGNLPPFEVVGLGGVELGRFWDEHRYQAYEGTSVPQFPNLWMVLGPYSFTGASWFSMIEASTTHALRCIREARRRGATLVAVRQDVHDAYFADILRRQRNTVFFNNSCGAANSYYFDRHGDAPFVRPSSGLEMWWRSRTFPLRHYRFEGDGRAPAAGWRTLPRPRVAPLPLHKLPLGRGLAIAGLLKLLNRLQTPNIFATIARHRRVFRAWVRFGWRVAVRGSLGRRQTELVVLRTAWNCGCYYVWTHHQLLGRLSGLDRTTIARVACGPDAAGWSADEAALLRAVDELHEDACIGDATWDALASRYDDRQRIELCFLVGHYEMLAMALNSLGVQYEHGPSPV